MAVTVDQKDFIDACYACEFDAYAVRDRLKQSHPGYAMKPNKIEKRIANYRKKGLLPLASGNSISKGEILKGSSTLYDKNGNITLQWVKTDIEKESQVEAFTNALENLPGIITPIKPKIFKGNTNKDLLVKIPIADAHIGLLTWHKEVGTDFDIDIAKDLYTEAVTQLIDCSPEAETCLLLDLGDTIHTDDQSNQTKASKHQLDVDGRYDKLFDMTLHIVCSMIDIALTKYPKVIFRKTRGNHDPDASVGLSAAIAMRYINEPRVTIERSPNLFWWYKFGKTLHFSTHGHTVRKQSALPEIAAHDCKAVWSDCDFVYIDTGHVHHQQILETRTAVCESHNSLTAGDSFNYGHGYRSLRNIKAITYHKDYGEINRNIVTLKMLQAKSRTSNPII